VIDVGFKVVGFGFVVNFGDWYKMLLYHIF